MDSSSHVPEPIPHTQDGLRADASPLATSSPQRYWSESRLEITVNDEQGSKRTIIHQPFARVGSHPGSEIVIKGTEAARRHLYLQVIDEGIYYLDFVASQRLGRLTGGWIDSQKPLKIGPQELTVKLLAPNDCSVAVSPVTADPINTPVPDQAPILIGRKKNSLIRFSLLKRLTCMGRNPENRIRLHSREISPFHCVLFRDGSDLWIVDLLTASGTRLQRYRLGAGKVIQPLSKLLLGSVKFKLEIPAIKETEFEQQQLAVQRERAELQDLRGQFQAEQADLAQARLELQRELASLQDVRASLNTNQQDLAQSQAALQAAQEALILERTRFQAEQADLQAAHNACHERQASLDKLQTQLKDEQAGLQDLRGRFQAEQADLAQARLELQRELASLTDLGNSLKRDQHELEQSQAALRAAKEEMNDERAEMQDQFKELELRQHEWLAEQQVAQNRLAEERANFESQKKELDNLLAAATLRQQELDEQFAGLEQRQIQSSDELARLVQRQAALDHREANLLARESEQQHREHEKLARDQELLSLRKDLDDRDSALLEALNRVEAFEFELAQERTQLARFKTEIEELHGERINWQRELAEREQTWSDSLALADRKIGKLEQELATVRQEMAAALSAAEQTFSTNQSQWTQERADGERQRDQALAEMEKWREIVAERDQQIAELSAAADRFSLDRVSVEATAPLATPEQLAELAAREAALAKREQEVQDWEQKVGTAQEQLDKARQALELEALNQHSQVQVLANLHELRREKSWWYRLLEFFRH